eukprot:5127041-Amphidinium_carterae.1
MSAFNMGESMDLDVQILGTTSAAAVSDAAEPTAPPERFSKQQRNRTATLLSLFGKCRVEWLQRKASGDTDVSSQKTMANVEAKATELMQQKVHTKEEMDAFIQTCLA